MLALNSQDQLIRNFFSGVAIVNQAIKRDYLLAKSLDPSCKYFTDKMQVATPCFVILLHSWFSFSDGFGVPWHTLPHGLIPFYCHAAVRGLLLGEPLLVGLLVEESLLVGTQNQKFLLKEQQRD